MRFREFDPKRNSNLDKQLDELVPAIGLALRGVGGAAIQATRNAAAMGAKALSGAKKVGQTVGSTAAAVAQTQLGKTQDPEQDIPAVGSELVLPDKDTKQPGTFTVKSMRGNEVELEPVTKAKQTNDPKVSVQVNKRDLANTLKAVSPDAKDKRTL
jgi:hypothetical protein